MTDLKPGRELDALISEKVMGNKDWPGRGQCSCGGYCVKHGRFPQYSASIAAAWEVVEHLQRWKFTLTWEYDFGGGGVEPFPYATAIFDPVFTEMRPGLFVKAETAPHAICLAALKAVGND